jgi:hypothetical protein
VNHFVDFSLDVLHREDFSERELKDLTRRFQQSMERKGFEVGDLFGSSTDLWGFSVESDDCDILLGLSPDSKGEDRWDVMFQLGDPGWFKNTREIRIGFLNRVEWGFHEALVSEFKARNLAWFLGKGRISRQMAQPTPPRLAPVS